jgi:hypothetical protein
VSCGHCEWCRAGRTNLCSTYLTLGLQLNGGLAQLVKTPAAVCRQVPDVCSDDAAAMAQPLAVALHALRRTSVKPGQTCVVIGVGGIGSFILGAPAAKDISPLIADIDDQRLRTAHPRREDRDRREDKGRRRCGARGDGRRRRARRRRGLRGSRRQRSRSGDPAWRTRSDRRSQPTPTEIDLFALTTREVEIRTAVAHVCDVDLPESLEIISHSTSPRPCSTA